MTLVDLVALLADVLPRSYLGLECSLSVMVYSILMRVKSVPDYVEYVLLMAVSAHSLPFRVAIVTTLTYHQWMSWKKGWTMVIRTSTATWTNGGHTSMKVE